MVCLVTFQHYVLYHYLSVSSYFQHMMSDHWSIIRNVHDLAFSTFVVGLFVFVAKNNDAKKLMEVYSLFEEENILPDRGVLSYTAKALQILGQPVPFDIPPQIEHQVIVYFSLLLYAKSFANHGN